MSAKLDVVSSLRVFHMSVLLFHMVANESSVQVIKIVAIPTLVVITLLPTYVTHTQGLISWLPVFNKELFLICQTLTAFLCPCGHSVRFLKCHNGGKCTSVEHFKLLRIQHATNIDLVRKA